MGGGLVDDRVRELDFKAFDLLLLGGDLAPATSRDQDTLELLDRIFDLRSPDTLWTLGNHDYHDAARVRAFTGHRSFYRRDLGGIRFIILDTQLTDGSVRGEQFAFLKESLESCRPDEFRHVVILTHKLIWLWGSADEPGLKSWSDAKAGSWSIANWKFGDCGGCTPRTDFHKTVYPLLAGARRSGLGVYLISGDLGLRARGSAYETREGVLLVGSGIREGDPGAEALLITDAPGETKLRLDFVKLDDLPRRRRTGGPG